MLTLTDASAAVEVGDTLAITGTIPTSWELGALDLTQHMGELGFLNRFEGTSTRVLVTVGADGLPQTLEFAGTGIGRPEVDLPDYVIEELGVLATTLSTARPSWTVTSKRRRPGSALLGAHTSARPSPDPRSQNSLSQVLDSCRRPAE